MTDAPKATGKYRAAALWGAGGAFIASLCCLPLGVAVLLGVGSLSLIAGLAYFKTWFLVLGVVVGLLGIYVGWWRPNRACAPSQRRSPWPVMATLVGTFGVGYVLMFYGIPTLAYWQAGQQSQAAGTVLVPTPGSVASPTSAVFLPGAAPQPVQTPAAAGNQTVAVPPQAAWDQSKLSRATLAIKGMG